MAKLRPSTRFAVLAHTLENTTGFPDAFVDYLVLRGTAVTHVRYPFHLSISKTIKTDKYRDGRLWQSEQSWIRFYRPQILSFFKDFCWTLFVGARRIRQADFVLVSNNLLGFAAILLRGIGWVKQVTYLVIDYSPRRFENPLIEWIYVNLDRFVAYRADSVWAMSPAMLEGRARDGKLEMNRVRWRVSPVGNYADRFLNMPPPFFSERTLVYVGNPAAKNVRADLLVHVAAELKRRGHSFVLKFIGPGDTAGLQELSVRLNVRDSIEFLGTLPTANELDDELSRCGLGLAPYDTTLKDNFSAFADPAKIKTYLGVGLPVITTSVPPIALEVAQRRAGSIVEFSAEAFANEIIRYWNDADFYKTARRNSLMMGGEYSWSSIFEKLLKAEGFSI